MEMSLKQSTLVLLTVAIAVMSAQVTVTLDEEQKRVDVPHGSSLTLYCSLEGQGRFRIAWFFKCCGNKTIDINATVFNKSTKTSNETSSKTKQNLKEDLPKHTLSSVTYNDSGWYFCNVTIEIPYLKHYESKGAEVIVGKYYLYLLKLIIVKHYGFIILSIVCLAMMTGTGKTVTEHTTYQTQVHVSPTNFFEEWWLWILVGGSVLVLIVLIIICVLMRRRQHIRELQTPIYGNMRPSPRPGAPADKLKTVSSCQNLRTPNPGRKYEESKMRYK
ncbi:uncharacterized protein LOC121900196 [Scomber scombrus]|uniref:Uncharacterized protein LOC121900196 n=1 Tax=Scomber scombrus TaxID=13677 RepID=A0AAV1N6N3_SCOSC